VSRGSGSRGRGSRGRGSRGKVGKRDKGAEERRDKKMLQYMRVAIGACRHREWLPGLTACRDLGEELAVVANVRRELAHSSALG
jgi:hypothetical protein